MNQKIVMASKDDVQALIASAIEPLTSAIKELRLAVSKCAVASEVGTAVFNLQNAINSLSNAVATHVNDSNVHFAAGERTTLLQNSVTADTVYTRVQIDNLLAQKASQSDVTSLQSDKADASNTYTKQEIDTKDKALSGCSYDYSDWTNGALAAAVKEIYNKLGGTVQEA